MTKKLVRRKALGTRLQTPPAAQCDVGPLEETQAQPQHQAPSPERSQNVSNDEETKEREPPSQTAIIHEEQKESEPPRVPSGDLFRGHKFYLARTLRAERRAELRILITQNGGEVMADMVGGAIEIVERGQLKPGENWVAAEFIEDSVEGGVLKEIMPYIALPASKPRRTASGRPPKRFFTVDEQAKMLQFLHEKYPKYYNQQTVPERIWKDAVAQQLFDRTSSSLHEHYRKQLVPLTKQERAVIFDKAGMANLDEISHATETEPAEAQTRRVRRPRVVAAKRKEAAVKSVAADGADKETTAPDREKDGGHSDEEIQGRAKKRTKKPTSRSLEREDEAKVEAENEEAETRVEPTPDADTLVFPSDDEVVTSRQLTLPPVESTERVEAAGADANHEENEHAHDNVELPAAEEEEAEEENATDDEHDEQALNPPAGEMLSSYWHAIAFNASKRPLLDRFFIPPPPPPAAADSPTSLLHSAPRTPQPKRVHRLSHAKDPFAPSTPKKQASPTPQKRRRSGRFSLESMSTPGRATRPQPPPRSAPQELLSQLEEMVGQRMTPPSKRKSLDRLIPVSEASADDADTILSQLQFETGHDLNTVCSALYWASGDRDVARVFLLGHTPPEIWCPHDDQLLTDFKRADISDVELANARHRGAFNSMTTKRTTRDILKRIRFLL